MKTAEEIQYGVYACGSRGGQVDTGRGSFQFAAQEAYLIENGEITTPLRDVSVSGLTLQILNDVDGLTKDAKLASPGFCGKGQTVPVTVTVAQSCAFAKHWWDDHDSGRCRRPAP